MLSLSNHSEKTPMPKIPLKNRAARYAVIFAGGFAMGAAFMATPALGFVLMCIAAVFVGMSVLRNI